MATAVEHLSLPKPPLRKRFSAHSLRSLIAPLNHSSISLPSFPTTHATDAAEFPVPSIPLLHLSTHTRKRSLLSLRSSRSSQPQSAKFVTDLPNELLVQVVAYLDLSALFALYNVSRHFRSLAVLPLVRTLEPTKVRLWFHQEGLRRTFVEFRCRAYDAPRERLIFECTGGSACLFKTGVGLGKPQLDDVTLIAGPTVTCPLKAASENYLDTQCPLRVKHAGAKELDGQRHSFGTRYPWTFKYTVEYVRGTVKVSADPARAAEGKHRLLRPGVFECSPNFLDPKRGAMNVAVRWCAEKFGEAGTITQWVRNRGKKWSRGKSVKQAESGLLEESLDVPIAV
ncbi:hypothetical protein BC936DRAFT_141803 [Jimgerdemannia flammicorona]|uniref:F-box domain-containing protein n=1 Tax=Jimgerdemannia flammicorona TaxID=994334 RepID=A0A433DFR1_9FUNG|nr:hypothetical protein BC936DRAFT_141803 [Jimgerdemannia flammicorona]